MNDVRVDAAWARRLAGALLGDAGAADDAAQDVWLKARTGSRSRGWLRSVIGNRLRDGRRAERRRRGREEVAGAAAPAVITPQELVGRAEVQKTLAALVGALPEPARQVIHLVYYEGLAPKQVAARLGVPDGTVRWRLKTALDDLRARVERRYREEQRDWRRALLPLLPLGGRPGRAGAGRGLLVALGSLALVAGAGAGLARCDGPGGTRSAGSAPAADRAGGERAAGSRTARRGGRPVQLASGALPLGCPAEVERLEGELARAQDALHHHLPPERIWEDHKEVNATATAALAPIVERYLDAHGAPRAERSFECRNDACLAKVIEPWPPRPSWSQRPPADASELAARTRMLKLRGPERKLSLGALGHVAETWLWFRLNRADGAPGPAPVPAFPARILPSAAVAAARAGSGALSEECRDSTRALEAALEDVRMRATSQVDTAVLFAAEAPNPELGASLGRDVDRVVAAALPKLRETDRSPVITSCRGLICEIRPTDGGRMVESMARDLIRDEQIRARIRRSSFHTRNGRVEGGVHLVLLPPAAESRSGDDVLRVFANQLRADGTLANCEARFPATGNLTLELLVPGAGEVNADGVPGRISFALHGPLAGSAYAQCLGAGIAAAAASFELPADVSRRMVSKTFELPSER